jgi:hypothetical protein
MLRTRERPRFKDWEVGVGDESMRKGFEDQVF